MANKETLQGVLDEMAQDLEPGLNGISVAGTDGMGIAYHKVSGKDAETLGAQMALILQVGGRSTERMKYGDLEDVLVTTDKGYLLARFVGNGKYLCAVSADSSSVLGNVRLVLSNFGDRIYDAVPSK